MLTNCMRNHNTTLEQAVVAAAAAYTHRSVQLGNDSDSTAPAQTRLTGAARGVRAVSAPPHKLAGVAAAAIHSAMERISSSGGQKGQQKLA